MLLTALVILLLFSLMGGVWGQSRWGYAGWSPLGVVLLILLILWLTGNLNHLHLGRLR